MLSGFLYYIILYYIHILGLNFTHKETSPSTRRSFFLQILLVNLAVIDSVGVCLIHGMSVFSESRILITSYLEFSQKRNETKKFVLGI